MTTGENQDAESVGLTRTNWQRVRLSKEEEYQAYQIALEDDMDFLLCAEARLHGKTMHRTGCSVVLVHSQNALSLTSTAREECTLYSWNVSRAC